MPRAIVGIGGNLGAGRGFFSCAEAQLARAPGCRLVARSRLYETPAIGPPQPNYLNAAFAVDWAFDPTALFRLLCAVERGLGRKRRERWGPRTVDLDFLHWSEGPVRTADLIVPHPELLRRTFALAPLLDVAPDLSEFYAPALGGLGGAPPLADPGWLSPDHPGYALNLGDAALLAHAGLLMESVEQCDEPT